MSENDSTRQQRLIDALQVIGPLAQRIDITARQQQQDAAALLEATARAIAEARPDESSAGGIRTGSVVDSSDARRHRGTVVALDVDLGRAVVRWPDGDETTVALQHLTLSATNGSERRES